MALTPGALSQVSVTAVGDVLSSAVATSGTTPYTYQWYRSITSGFTPGTGNILSGKTSLSLTDSSLTPGTIYYYKVVVVDSNGTPVTATSAQLAVTTIAAQPSISQFAEGPFLGQTDLPFNSNTLPVLFDPTGSGTLYAGMAVKWSTVAGGVPMVVPSTAQADVIAGFVNFNIKDISYVAGEMLEISMAQNVMYLYATAAINRGSKLVSLPAAVAGGCNGGVAATTGSSGFPIIGYALDTAVSGALMRVFLQTPSGRLDS